MIRGAHTTLAIAVTIVGVAVVGCATGAGESDGTPATAAAPTAPVPTAPATAPPDSSPPDSASTTAFVTDSAPVPPARLLTDLDAAGFADRLSSSHAIMTDGAASAAERAAAGVDHQLVLRELAGRPELDDIVLNSLDPVARPSVERIVRARQFLQQRSTSRPSQPLPDELPAWTISEPESVDALLEHYAEAEHLSGIPWYWLAAIHLQETRMGRVEGVSAAGAVGPMQFLPTTWARCCAGDPTVTRDAIIGAGTYLAQSGGPDDMASALYQYNPNDGYVAVVTAYAESLRDEPELYPGYHAFQVFFGTSAGTVRLPVGYSETTPIAAAGYLASNPQDAA